MIDIETELKIFYINNMSSIMFQQNKMLVTNLEATKMNILQVHKETWCQKSRVLWLGKDDMNTNLFHHFTEHESVISSSWDLSGIDQNVITNQKKLEKEAINNFQAIFKNLVIY